MASALRKTGIDIVGDMPWGTHFCHFYETRDDLLDTLVPYFKAGLEDNEFCVWVVPEPLTEDEAWKALRGAVPAMDRHVAGRSMEIFRAREWYLRGGKLDQQRVTAAWNEKLAGALARGYAGMRVSGTTAWLDKKDWRDFCEYEEQLNGSISNQLMTVLCTSPLLSSGATEFLDVVRTHQFAIAKRQGGWQAVETPELKQAKAEIAKLNEELERRVVERTGELQALKDELDADLLAMTRLHEFSTRLHASMDLQPLLDEVLNATIALQHADFGNVQLYNPDSKALEIVAQRGFRQDFLDHFSRVDEDGAACGRALQRGERVVVEDVQLDPGFAPHRAIAASAGFRAAQSTPLFSRSGEPLGMISTHFRQPHRPSDRDLRLTDLYARQAAEMIERRHAEESRRQAAEALHKAQAELAHVTRLTTIGELAASLAHELNQPLSAVVTSGSACQRWLNRAQPDIPEALAAVERIIRDANRASEVIAHTRALLRKTSGEKRWLEVVEVVREVLILVRPEVLRQRIVIRESLAKDLPPVLGDRILLQQVVLNLIVNGIEAMTDVADPGRELAISAERHGVDDSPGVLVAVRDSGVGIAPEHLDRLFEAFYTTKAHGLGMGLSISRSIIQQHGGRLWASANAGLGATFQFVLPAWSKPD